MRIRSFKQYQLMKDVAEGRREVPGLSQEMAQKMIADITPKEAAALPEISPNTKTRITTIEGDRGAGIGAVVSGRDNRISEVKARVDSWNGRPPRRRRNLE